MPCAPRGQRTHSGRVAEEFTVDSTVQASEGSEWLSIESTVGDEQLETISSVLQTTALTLYAQDEKILRFGYTRFENGRLVRALKYLGRCNAEPRGKWVTVEGEPEAWEATCCFSPELMELYRQHAPDEVNEMSGHYRVMPGLWIPWAADLGTVAEIARALQLPWNPARNPAHDQFPPATHTEVIPGTPEREKAFFASTPDRGGSFGDSVSARTVPQTLVGPSQTLRDARNGEPRKLVTSFGASSIAL